MYPPQPGYSLLSFEHLKACASLLPHSWNLLYEQFSRETFQKLQTRTPVTVVLGPSDCPVLEPGCDPCRMGWPLSPAALLSSRYHPSVPCAKLFLRPSLPPGPELAQISKAPIVLSLSQVTC